MKVKIYCECCDESVVPEIEPLQRDELNDIPWGDIVCPECHFVINTLSSDVEGIVAFRVEPIPKIIVNVTPGIDINKLHQEIANALRGRV